ncbi:MAG TPA: DUF1015 domain-containing protein [Oscillospiraceae bacterium]|nr:DUF1015 domain-containing protein [Oscillospiraceae bacterium]HPF56653.1 DUF1015 domain-containing protein [Clostridiales bacterium]HPK36284.1 DUF1015 domain-containing protein [Oscillospiraceae bacterium]HPR75015.1 DUF1015 domain-containing protein [Oscillospiraceae bacterium]
MARVSPFCALRYNFNRAGEPGTLVCPPYDAVSEKRRAELAETNPNNAIVLELPTGSDKYAAAKFTLNQMLEDGVLFEEQTPCLYYYERTYILKGETKRIGGYVARVGLAEHDEGVIIPHENTLSGPKADRFELLKITGCSFSPVYALFEDKTRELALHTKYLTSEKPEVEFTAEGDLHRFWVIKDAEKYQPVCNLFTDKKLFIADGHHRYETALNFRRHLRESGVKVEGDHPANSVMILLCDIDDPGLTVLPIHRLLHSLPDFDAASLLKLWSKDFNITRLPNPGTAEAELTKHTAQNAFGFYAGGDEWYLMTLKTPIDSTDPLDTLDVSVLHKLILEPMGIDRENMAAQKNLDYTKSAEELIAGVQSGKYNAGFFMNGTKVSQITAVAGAGEKMPQKSTWFFPKPVTGLYMNKIL